MEEDEKNPSRHPNVAQYEAAHVIREGEAVVRLADGRVSPAALRAVGVDLPA